MNDVVTKPLLYIHETRRRSDGHVDGVTVASRRVDAIDANLKFGNVQKRTLSHGRAHSRPVRNIKIVKPGNLAALMRRK